MLEIPKIYEFNFRPVEPDQAFASPKNENKWKATLSKIRRMTKTALKGFAGAAMFSTNPTVFTLGFISGIIWDKKVQEIINKVKLIWNSQPWSVLLLSGIASFLALQVTWAAGSLLFAANLGCKMAQRARIANERFTEH